MEAKARGADVIALVTEDAVDAVADLGAVVTVPACDPVVAPILLSIPAQIVAISSLNIRAPMSTSRAIWPNQ